jgi:phage terminase large subunit-like protein
LQTISANLPIRKVHATRGKQLRAEPVVSLFEQGRVHHVGVLAELEEQCCTWVPGVGRSPDHLDALVYAITDLAEGRRRRRMIAYPRTVLTSPVKDSKNDPMIA